MATVATAVEVNAAPTTTAAAAPIRRRTFAVRRRIEILAVVCECGATSHGRGVRKWKKCPRCGAPIITSHEQRYRDAVYRFIDDEHIYQRHTAGEVNR